MVAVDVGTGQLAWSLRNDPRVTVRERLNARHLTLADVGEPVDLVRRPTCRSSRSGSSPRRWPAWPPTAPTPSLLIKPQFEAGRAEVRRGGLVTDPAVHLTVLEDVTAALGRPTG